MNYAIIAAGDGSRLKKEGFNNVKPLVKVCGEFLIERLIRIFKNNNATSVSIIINEESKQLKSYLNSMDWQVKINLIVKSTPSSLHSFWNIIQQTDIDECCLTTVDTIFNEKDFSNYISYFQKNKTIDALMATTEYIDDEKPLYIKTDKNNNILAFCDKKENEDINKVSAGIYCLRKKAILMADKCIKKDISRMRNYQRSLISEKLDVKSFLFSKVIDIDHIEDIKKAENLLKNFSTNILAIERFADYSPNSQNKDKEILNAVKTSLIQKGYNINSINENNIDFTTTYYPYVISMARNPKVIEQLFYWQKKGSQILNTPLSCKNCYRESQIKILQDNKINIPKTEIIATNCKTLETIPWLNEKDFWIKRGDFQTIEKIDVIKIACLQEAYAILDNYNSRGINKAILSQDIDGDIIKFYGVSKTNWFYYYYPTKDKFDNAINTSINRIEINKKAFISMCQKAATVLDLDIYGGDAAVDKDGNFYIIDMNDFPSFSSCKKQATDMIVKRFLDKCNI